MKKNSGFYLIIVFALLVGCVRGGLGIGVAWLLKAAADIVTGGNGMKFSSFCALAAGYYIVYMAVYWMGKRLYLAAAKALRIRGKERLFEGLLWAPEKVHRGRKAGDVLSKFQYQLDLLEKSCYDPLYSLIVNAVVLVVSAGAALFLQWYIALGITAFFVLYLVMTKGIHKKVEGYQRESARLQAEEQESIVTMVKGYGTARDYGREDYFLARYTACARASARAACKCNFYYNILALIGTNLETITTLLIILAGGIMLEAGKLGITAGAILGITQLASGIIGPVGSLGPAVSQIKGTKAVRQDFAAFRRAGAEGKAEWTQQEEALPKLETLSLSHVSFSYEGKPVLQDVSMTMKAGGKYAIVGESGSGKSTLVKLILKQLEPDSGSVYWNEKPYGHIRKAELLPRIGYAAQEPMIFHKDIRENIAAGGGFSQEADGARLRRALAHSGVAAMREGMPEEELLAVSAQELSGGEKKRVAYARALYKDCEILAADEMTSALHEDMALALEEELLKTEGLLVIHVTHRLSEQMRPLYDGIFSVGGCGVTAL